MKLINSKMIKKLLIMVPLVFTLVGILTFVMTFQNLGFVDGFFNQWLSSTVWAATTMAPLGFVMVALVGKAVSMFLPKASERIQNTVIGILMAIIMEGFMALVTTINNLSGVTGLAFFTQWWHAFLIAIPVGLMISMVMTLAIKPRIERFMAS